MAEEIERPDIIKPGNMIFVWMCKQDRVNVFSTGSQHLVSKVRCGINYDLQIGRRKHDAAAEAIIFRIFGLAHFTATADHRYTTAGTGTQKIDIKMRITHQTNLLILFRFLHGNKFFV